VNGSGDGVERHCKDIARFSHVDLLDKVVVLHDFAKFADHGVGRAVDLAKEVGHVELLERAQQIFDSESPGVRIVVRRIVVKMDVLFTIIKPRTSLSSFQILIEQLKFEFCPVWYL
jgi:hypothetical protein